MELSPLGREEARGRARHADALARLLRGAMEIGDRYDDEIKRRFPKMIRRVSGYGLDALVDPETLDLTRLVCGSEGTLAIVTRAEFRLHPLPETRALASFEFDSLSAAARATNRFLQMDPSAIELLDDVAIGRARANPAYRDSTRFVQGDPKAVLVVEWSGTEGQLDERFAGLDDLAGEVGAPAATPLRTKEEMGQTVRLRKSTLPLLLGTTDNEKPVAFVEDAAVPPDRLEEFVRPLRGDRREVTVPGPASTGTPAWDACTSGLRWIPRTPMASRGCGTSPRRSQTSSSTAAGPSRVSTATASRVRSSWRGCTGGRSCALSRTSSVSSTPKG